MSWNLIFWDHFEKSSLLFLEENLNLLHVLLVNVHLCYHVSYIVTARRMNTCILKVNQYGHKDTESAVGDADLVHVQYTRYSMQMGIYSI